MSRAHSPAPLGASLAATLAASCVAVALAAPTAAGQTETGGFVVRRGADTLGVERFTRADGHLMGDLTIVGQPRLTYDARIGAAGRVASVAITAFAPRTAPDAAPLQRAVLRLAGDSVVVDITARGTTHAERLASRPGAFLLVNTSFAMIDLLLDWLTRQTAAGGALPVFLTTGGQTLPASARRVGPDSVTLTVGPQQVDVVTRGARIVRVHVAGLVADRVDGAVAARLGIGKPDYAPPAGAPYRAESVRVPTPSGIVLAGTLTLPAGAAAGARVPAVVTITGSGPQDRDEYIPLAPGYRPFRQLADTLGRRGLAVLRLDDRGTGESGGDFATATSADFADDVRAAVTWLRARPEIDPARIALVGHSEGGLIAPLVASTDPAIAAIVLMAGPVQRGREIIGHQIRYAVEHDTSIAESRRDSAIAASMAAYETTLARAPWMQFFSDYDPAATAATVRTPVLVLHGATDRQVSADQAERLGAIFRASGNRDVTVRVFPDHNHLFLLDPDGDPAGYTRLPSGHVGPEVMGVLTEWLVSRLARGT